MFEGRIARFDGPGEPFTIESVSLPGVGPGEILVRITRANICGSDVHAWHGTFATRGLGGQLPTVLGHEMVGAVAALGEGVTTDSNGGPLQEGTRVVFPYFFCCHTCRNCLAGRRNACLNLKMAMLGRADAPPYFVGGYGDYFLLPAGAVVYTVPDTVSDEIAAGANCALSQVMYGLERVEGDHAALLGPGDAVPGDELVGALLGDRGVDIVLIGHAGHEEVEGTTGEAPESITLVEGPDDVAKLQVNILKRKEPLSDQLELTTNVGV